MDICIVFITNKHHSQCIFVLYGLSRILGIEPVSMQAWAAGVKNVLQTRRFLGYTLSQERPLVSGVDYDFDTRSYA